MARSEELWEAVDQAVQAMDELAERFALRQERLRRERLRDCRPMPRKRTADEVRDELAALRDVNDAPEVEQIAEASS